jgi:RNA polymerase sigma-70 factor, ECF subfamily
MGVSDEGLQQHLHALALGNEQALGALYQALSGKVYAIALRMLENKEEAQEVMQDTFLQLYRQAKTHRSDLESVTAFTFTIARNFSISRLRSRRSRPIHADEYDVHDPQTAPAAPIENDATDRLVLEQAMAQLQDDERRLLEASFFDGYTHQELCDRYALPLGSLKSKLRRALLKLRNLIGAA